MNILFLSRWFPFPTDNGSKIRILNLLRGLAPHHDVTLLSFSDQSEVNREAVQIRSLCAEVHVVPWREFNPQSLRAKLGFLSLKPRSIVDTFSPEMARKISQVLNRKKYDLVIASQLPMAAYRLFFKDVPAVLDELELGLNLDDSRRALDWKKRLRRSLGWFKLRLYLSRLLESFHAVTVVSEREKDLVRKNFPRAGEILVVPNCISMEEYRLVRVEPKPNTMIFTGSFRYQVNYEAMVWFVREVFPLVLEKIPAAELIITGDHLDLPLPTQKNIRLTGYVDDVRPWIAASAVALAPLWSGGGTRLKILEAMAIGTPVVATSKGAEGLDAVSGEHLVVADDTARFADDTVRILSDQGLRDRLTRNAQQLIREKYDWQGVLPGYLGFLDRVVRL